MSWSDGNDLLQAIYSEVNKLVDSKNEQSIYFTNIIEGLLDLDIEHEEITLSDSDFMKLVEQRSEIIGDHWSRLRKQTAQYERRVVSHLISQAQKQIEIANLEALNSDPIDRMTAFTSCWKISMKAIDEADARKYFTQSLVDAFHINAEDIPDGDDALSKLDQIVQELKMEDANHLQMIKNLIGKEKDIVTLEKTVSDSREELQVKLASVR